MDSLNISVIIAAHNAEETIAETLASLQAQTYPNWEAIVVDDGSTDLTAAIVASLGTQDSRFRVVTQQPKGVSAARNSGLEFSRSKWVLFLDADDWISPHYFERLNNTLISAPGLDAIVCGSARVGADGKLFVQEYLPEPGDLFNTLARFSAFPIHACAVRRSLVDSVGGFDASFCTCEEWDLWQRIARTGAQFGIIHEVLAFYRMRSRSLSQDSLQMLIDGLRVIKQGCSPDPRVRTPHPAHANGLISDQSSARSFHFLCWCAALAIGSRRDARPMIEVIKEAKPLRLDPKVIAKNFYEATPLSTCQTPSSWNKLWPDIERGLDEFLVALENRVQDLGLARSARKGLERLILEHLTPPGPLTIGTTYALRIDISEPIPDVTPSGKAETLLCIAEYEGEVIGSVELPICEGVVPRYVLTDSIAAEFAWPIIGRFFESTVYRDLQFKKEPAGLSVYRGNVALAEGLSELECASWLKLHDGIGWTVFLQEIWGRPDWLEARFYDRRPTKEKANRVCPDDDWLSIEVSEDLPDVEASGKDLALVLTVGGSVLGLFTLPVKRGFITAQELRAALTTEGGFELCRLAVREGLMGRPLNVSNSLRERLYTAKVQALDNKRTGPISEVCGSTNVVPGFEQVVRRALYPAGRGVVIGRRAPGPIGSSASRRAMLPRAAAKELMESASVAGEPVLILDGREREIERVVYAPDLTWRPESHGQLSVTQRTIPNRPQSVPARSHDRASFESLFATAPDPWKYTTSYEATKYLQTMDMIPEVTLGRALEIGCAEGHFTLQLAPRVGRLIAADISEVALKRAAERCAGLTNVDFVRLDLTTDKLPGRFDLIVCSEVLYYVGHLKALRVVAHRFAEALEPGGYLVMAHANLVVDEPDKTGFDWDDPFGAKVIGEVFSRVSSLRFLKELKTPLYRIQLFQRYFRRHLFPRRPKPEVIEVAEVPPPHAEAASHILWQGGSSSISRASRAIVTERLPILMYHRVAPSGSGELSRYRVTPEAFEGQLRYLSEAGYSAVTLDEWRANAEMKQPLPGRAVLLTFDDGYLDFLEHAWPLLKRYGFSAIVFLVADKIGKSNSWDQIYGEEVPLLGWKDIHQLQDEGAEFGSHSATHPYLTGLSHAEVVSEGARSRAILQRELRRPITAFTYPYGAENQVVQHLVGACGYIFGLSCRPGPSRFQDSLLALPRIEVSGSDGLIEFIGKLSIDPARG